jgi:hypothetical protein
MKEPDIPEAEDEVRALLAAATADIPPGIDLLRGVQARRAARRMHLRVALPAAAAVVLAAAVMITLTLVQAPPSALAQLTSAVSRTAAQSYYFSEMTTTVTLPGNSAPTTVRTGFWGAFDPARRTGEETTSTGAHLRFIGSYLYLDSRPAAGQPRLPAGVSWLEFPSSLLWAPVTDSRQLTLTAGMLSLAETSPQNLFTLLESASEVNSQGSASGPGWAGTRYGFSVTIALGPAGSGQRTVRATGTIDVDQQGQVRHLDAAFTVPATSMGPAIAPAPPERGTVEMTFSDFGAPVSVSAPPASEVFMSDSAPVIPGLLGGQ